MAASGYKLGHVSINYPPSVGFPDGKESSCQWSCRRRGFNPWVGKIPWRRDWIPTRVFLHEKFHGQKSLAHYSPWDCKESDRTKQMSTHAHSFCFHDSSQHRNSGRSLTHCFSSTSGILWVSLTLFGNESLLTWEPLMLPCLPLSPTHWLLPLRSSLVAQTIKNLPAMQETRVLVWGTYPGEGNGNLLQYSCLENPMEGWTLSLFTCTFSCPQSFVILRVQNCSSLPLVLNDIFSQKRGQCPSSNYDPLRHRKPQRIAFVP